jgi:hypothetical protein
METIIKPERKLVQLSSLQFSRELTFAETLPNSKERFIALSKLAARAEGRGRMATWLSGLTGVAGEPELSELLTANADIISASGPPGYIGWVLNQFLDLDIRRHLLHAFNRYWSNEDRAVLAKSPVETTHMSSSEFNRYLQAVAYNQHPHNLERSRARFSREQLLTLMDLIRRKPDEAQRQLALGQLGQLLIRIAPDELLQIAGDFRDERARACVLYALLPALLPKDRPKIWPVLRTFNDWQYQELVFMEGARGSHRLVQQFPMEYFALFGQLEAREHRSLMMMRLGMYGPSAFVPIVLDFIAQDPDEKLSSFMLTQLSPIMSSQQLLWAISKTDVPEDRQTLIRSLAATGEHLALVDAPRRIPYEDLAPYLGSIASTIVSIRNAFSVLRETRLTEKQREYCDYVLSACDRICPLIADWKKPGQYRDENSYHLFNYDMRSAITTIVGFLYFVVEAEFLNQHQTDQAGFAEAEAHRLLGLLDAFDVASARIIFEPANSAPDSFISDESLNDALETLVSKIESSPQQVLFFASELRFAARLSGQQLDTAIEKIGLLVHEEARSRSLVSLVELAPQITLRQKERILAIITAQTKDKVRTEALVRLLPHLAEARSTKAIGAALSIENEWFRAQVFEQIAPYLTEKSLQTAFDNAMSMKYETAKSLALRALRPHLPEAPRLIASDALTPNIEQTNKSAERLFSAGLKLLHSGDLPKAIEFFHQAIALNSELRERAIDSIGQVLLDGASLDLLDLPEQTEGNLRDEKDSRRLENGLVQYYRFMGVPEAQLKDTINQAKLLVIRAKVKNVPVWDERSNEVRYLTAPLYLKQMYSFLIDKSGQVQHEDLLREHDAKVVHLVQQYISQRILRNAGDLGDAEGLSFEGRDSRGRPRRADRPPLKKRKVSLGRPKL